MTATDALPDAADARPNGDHPEVRPVLRSAGEVLRGMLGTDLARLVAADPVARLGEDTEGVHQARIATRRLRSSLATFRPILTRDETSALLGDLRWLSRSLAAVRDLDVLRERLADTLRSFDPLTRDQGMSVLARIEVERRCEAAHLDDVLSSPRYRKLLAALAATVARPPFRRSAGLPAEAFLLETIRDRYHAVAEAVDALAPGPTDEALHAVRILARPLRYVAEAGGAVLGAPCTRLGRRTAAACDLLGDLNDGARANEWLDGVEVERPHAFAVARLRATEIGRMAEARGAWRAAWARVGVAAATLGVDAG